MAYQAAQLRNPSHVQAAASGPIPSVMRAAASGPIPSVMRAAEEPAQQLHSPESVVQSIVQAIASQGAQQMRSVGGVLGGSSSQGASQLVNSNTQVPAALATVVNDFINNVANHISATAHAELQSESGAIQDRLSTLERDHEALIQRTTLATQQHQATFSALQTRMEHEHANVVRLMAELDTSNAAVRAAETALSATTLLVTAANNARDAAVTAGDAAVTAANNARDAAKLALANMTARLMAMITGVPVPPAADTATGQGASAANGGEGAQ